MPSDIEDVVLAICKKLKRSRFAKRQALRAIRDMRRQHWLDWRILGGKFRNVIPFDTALAAAALELDEITFLRRATCPVEHERLPSAPFLKGLARKLSAKYELSNMRGPAQHPMRLGR